MKYLKTFEKNNDFQFNIGEYVKIDTIIKSIKNTFFIIEDRLNDYGSFSYFVTNVTNLNKKMSFWEYESSIRKLKPKEKEDLETILIANKYNIYENKQENIKIGDIIKYKTKSAIPLYAKVLNITPKSKYKFFIEFIEELNQDKSRKLLISKPENIQELTPEEKEKIDLKLASLKYNL